MDFAAFVNYAGVENDPDVEKAILTYHEAGYLKAFQSLMT